MRNGEADPARTRSQDSVDSGPPEQDGNEDPGAGLEPLHDQGVTLSETAGMTSTTQSTSPSAVEHVDNTKSRDIQKTISRNAG